MLRGNLGMRKNLSKLFTAVCNAPGCKRTGPAHIVFNSHLFNPIMNCSYCCSYNIKIVAVTAKEGMILPSMIVKNGKELSHVRQ